jgi:hypothetical protein
LGLYTNNEAFTKTLRNEIVKLCPAYKPKEEQCNDTSTNFSEKPYAYFLTVE